MMDTFVHMSWTLLQQDRKPSAATQNKCMASAAVYSNRAHRSVPLPKDKGQNNFKGDQHQPTQPTWWCKSWIDLGKCERNPLHKRRKGHLQVLPCPCRFAVPWLFDRHYINLPAEDSKLAGHAGRGNKKSPSTRAPVYMAAICSSSGGHHVITWQEKWHPSYEYAAAANTVFGGDFTSLLISSPPLVRQKWFAYEEKAQDLLFAMIPLGRGLGVWIWLILWSVPAMKLWRRA